MDHNIEYDTGKLGESPIINVIMDQNCLCRLTSLHSKVSYMHRMYYGTLK